MTTFKMKGLSEMQASLRKLPDKLQDKALKSASSAGARVIAREAKALAPVDTGKLRDSIVVVRSSKSTAKKLKVSQIKGTVFVTLKGTARLYAHLVEFGTATLPPRSFMRKAFDAKSEEALKAMAPKLAKEIAKQAAKLSGWQPWKKLRRKI